MSPALTRAEKQKSPISLHSATDMGDSILGNSFTSVAREILFRRLKKHLTIHAVWKMLYSKPRNRQKAEWPPPKSSDRSG